MSSPSRMLSRRGVLGLASALGAGALIGLRFDGGPDYARLVRLWRRRLDLESELFQRLRFTLSPIQLRSGMTLKLVLRDQLGDDWFFKMGRAAVDGAEAVYRAGSLFGWETPELHRTKQPINGQIVLGSAQRFIRDAEELTGHVVGPKSGPRRLTDPALGYLLTAQLLGWITANHHVHTRQFVVTRKGRSVDRVYRIDNTVEWYLVGSDSLAADYVTPLLARKLYTTRLGYSWMWRSFRESVIDLPLTETYALARFIAEFPDEVFVESFLPGIENDYRFFTNVPHSVRLSQLASNFVPEGEKERFLERLLRRKRSLPEDTGTLFDEQLAARGVEADYRDGPSPRTIGEQLCALLQARIEELEQRSAELPREPGPQKPIHAITSFAAHAMLLHTFVPSNVSDDRAIQAERFQATIDELHGLRARTDDQHERVAIDIAIGALRAEMAAPRAPHEYLPYIPKLNELFPVFPPGESPRKD